MNILSFSTALLAAELPLGERMLYGLKVFAIGILTVFSVLAILWGVLVLFKLFAYDIPNKKKKKAEAAAAAEIQVPDVEDIPLASETEEVTGESDTQLIAVITAAIEAYSAQSGSGLPFRVVSYRRVKNSGGWQGSENNETF